MNALQPLPFDEDRRKWLIATSVIGGAGCAAAVLPFVESLDPPASALAAGAPVTVDISGLAPGTMMTVAWRGLPVFLVNRTNQMLAAVLEANSMVADPDSRRYFSIPLPRYCQSPYRSREEHRNLLVVIGVCTHLGCTPTPRFAPGAQASLPENWPGGFLCPCHGSTYDLSGRVFRNKPAPYNLDVPRFMFDSSTQVTIGRDEQGQA